MSSLTNLPPDATLQNPLSLVNLVLAPFQSVSSQHLDERQQQICAITFRDAEAYTAALLAESTLQACRKSSEAA
jgi:hypothetical protein